MGLIRELLRSVLQVKSGNIIVQLFRYGLAGGIAMIVDSSLLWVLTSWFSFHYLISTVIGYSVGLVITYTLSIFWVFNKRQKSSLLQESSLFLLIGVIGLGLTYLFMWIFTDILNVHFMLSKIVTVLIVFVWNFVAKKKILF